MAWRIVLVSLLLGGCSSPDAQDFRNPQVTLKRDLAPGEKIVCDGWAWWFGIPLATSAEGILGYHHRHFECYLVRV